MSGGILLLHPYAVMLWNKHIFNFLLLQHYGIQDLMSLFMKIQVFCNVTPYILVTSYRRFGGVCCLHLYRVFLNPENAGSQKIDNEYPEN